MKVASKTSSRRCWFTQQVVTLWNSLPQDAVGTTSLHGFKKQQDKHMEKEKKLNKDTRSASESPQVQIVGGLGNI